MAAQSAAVGVIEADYAPLETWTLALRQASLASTDHRVLVRITPKARPSAAMDCVAYEIARALLAGDGKGPSLGLRRFISARCGALVALPPYQSWTNNAPPEVSDERLIDGLLGQVHSPIDESARQSGFGIAREGTRVALVATFGTPEVELASLTQRVDEQGKISLRGRVAFETDALQGFINQDEHGVAPCSHDLTVVPPEFAMTCTLAPGDTAAWLELLAVPKGHVLGRMVIDLIAVRDDGAASTYAPTRAGASRPVASAAALEVAVVELVNGVRQRARMAPLSPATAQSRVASGLAPGFFNALLSPSPEAFRLVDQMSLGLLAGWQVQGGIIRSGGLTASLINGEPDAERWVSDALERPQGRIVLLDPEARQLAVGGTFQTEPQLLAAVATGYRFFDSDPPGDVLATEILERLADVRRARGRGETVMVTGVSTLASRLAEIKNHKLAPAEALQALLNDAAHATGRAVQGFVWETSDLEAIELPPELLRHGKLMISAGVTHYRAPGGAWGQYVVLFVIFDPPAGYEA